MSKPIKYGLPVILLFLTAAMSFGKGIKYSGYVADSISHSPIIGAVAMIFSPTDTLYATTDEEGGFVFPEAPDTPVVFEISHISYAPFRIETSLTSGQPELFFLERQDRTLKNAIVTSSAPVFTFDGDTLVYNVAATQEIFDGEMLGDVLGKLPAVENDGLLKIMGKAVSRAYINGRLIFGENTDDALRYLSGKEVISIKVYDETPMSERHRKYKSGDKERVINVKTRNRIDFVSSGHLLASYGRNFVSVGDDSDNRYTGGGSLNFFSEQWQIKTDAAIDNTGRENDPGKLLLTNAASSSYNRNINAGISAVRTFDIPKLYSIGFDYRYDNNVERDTSFSETVYSPSETFTERIYNNATRSLLRTGRHTASLKISSYDFITANLLFSADDNLSDYHSRMLSLTDGVNETVTQSTVSDRRSYSFSGNLVSGFEIGTRLFSLPSLDFSFANGTGSNIQIDTTATGIDRYLSDPTGKSYRIEAHIPLHYNFGDMHGIEMQYSLNVEKRKQQELRYLNAIDEANLDNLTSNGYTYDYTKHTATFRYRKNFLLIELPVMFSSQNQDRTLPAAENISHSYISFCPHVSYAISNFAKGRNHSFSFIVLNNLPSLEQSNPYINACNPLFISQGNPDLKQSITYKLSYNGNFLVGTRHSIQTTMTLNAVSNQIVEDRRFFATAGTVNGYTVPAGSSFSTYTNISGTWEVDFQLFYTTYFRRIKTKLDLRTDYTYDHSPALIEGEKIFSDRHNPKVRLTFTSTVSKNHKIVLRSITSNTYNHSREYGSVDYFDQSVSVSSENRFAKRFFLNAMWTYQVRIPVVGSMKISSNVLNAVAGVNFMKDNRLSASISCYDILDRTSSYSSAAAQNYVRTSFSPFLGRFWAVNLIWRFNTTE